MSPGTALNAVGVAVLLSGTPICSNLVVHLFAAILKSFVALEYKRLVAALFTGIVLRR
ncbi:hypothetical protein [Xylella fastidiosa]|uniref:hypothetical protein n=1 Tax=Xylella fastidiosa TaxID=2371 RepID=UPI0004297E9A|nr:hypothetical protein [Xylella fastidiosa]MDC7969841.1 hypothetical protein [Xylella fastidiosa subsp. multiplex]WDF06638.1 hypothetical protein PT012_09310 [Xylella fastidiosa subsp. multiplex]